MRLTFELLDDLRADAGRAELVLVANDEIDVLIEVLDGDRPVADFPEEGDETVLVDTVLVAATLLDELRIFVDAGTTEHSETDGLGGVTAQGGKVQLILFSSLSKSRVASTKYYYTPFIIFRQYTYRAFLTYLPQLCILIFDIPKTVAVSFT